MSLNRMRQQQHTHSLQRKIEEAVKEEEENKLIILSLSELNLPNFHAIHVFD